MHLTKHHVFGNDFLVCLDTGDAPCPLGWVRAVCNRTGGVGADGIMWVRPDEDPDPVAGPGGVPGARPLRAAMRLYNADGGEAEVSGNGLACLAQALTLRAGRDGAEAVIATITGDRRVVIDSSRFAHVDDAGGGFGRIRSRARIDLGRPSEDGERATDAEAILADLTPVQLRAGWVSVGNPHVVALVSDERALEVLPLESVGAEMQQRFGPVNFEAVAVVDRARVRMRVFERGVGVTSACGSGAAAVAWRLHQWGLVEGSVEVEMPGGIAEAIVGSTVELRVPVIYVADVEAPEPAALTGGDS